VPVEGIYGKPAGTEMETGRSDALLGMGGGTINRLSADCHGHPNNSAVVGGEVGKINYSVIARELATVAI